MSDNQIINDKYNTKYRKYSTNTLLESLKKFDKDSEIYLIIMMILVKRISTKDSYCNAAIIQLQKERKITVYITLSMKKLGKSITLYQYLLQKQKKI